MVISHNMFAMNANRQNGLVVKDVSKSTEKLSSGYKINRSADDAAGLSISEKMRKQIRGLSRASVNCEDGISYVQTADGALNEVHEMLQRSRELCIQAANGTNSLTDRKYIQMEIEQLNSEIDRVAQTTKFNESNIFISDNSKRMIRTPFNIIEGEIVSASQIRPVYFNYTDADLNAVIASAAADGKTISKQDLINFSNDIANNYVPQYLYGITQAFSQSATPSVSNMVMGFQYVYDNTSNAVAVCKSNGVGYEMSINLKYMPLSGGNSGSLAPDEQIKGSIAHELMHGVMFDITTNGMLGSNVPNGTDSFPDWFVEGMAESVNGIHAGALENIHPDTASNSTISNWLSSLTDTSDPYNAYQQGSVACLYLGYVSGGNVLDATSIAHGLDNILKDVTDGYSLSEAISRNTGYADLDDFTSKVPTDAIQFVKDYYNIRKGHRSSSLIAPGGLGADYNAPGGLLSMVNGSNKDNFFTLDVSKDYSGSLSNNMPLFGAAGVNPYTGGGGYNTNGTRRDGTTNTDAHKTWKKQPGHITGGINISGDDYSEAANVFISLHVGSESDLTNKIQIKQFRLSAYDLDGIVGANVLTEAGADDAMDRYENAIEMVSTIRSYFGAIQNRLEHTVKNLDNVVENTTAAESAIRDTDMATEAVKHANANVLAQSGQSMLAQANQMNQGVLSLIA